MMNFLVAAIAALLVSWSAPGVPSYRAPGPTAAAQAVPAPAPSLVVVLVVDQMRADYLERYAGRFTGGLRRLMTEGAAFDRAAYPYLNTVTCAGHSTIGTGTLPYRHGMVLNEWYDRAAGTSTACTSDPTVTQVSYDGKTGPGDSARHVLVPSLAEQMRRAGGRVVTMSLKARAAIGLAGHSADLAVWFEDRGSWATSSAFASAFDPALRGYIDAHPVAADYGKTWERTFEPSAYKNTDDGLGERPPAGWTRTFPHPLVSDTGTPDDRFFSLWARSPFADEYLGRMAAAMVDAKALGQGGRTDYLGVSFSSLDLVGHGFGPNSHEVQDMLVRLDRTIGQLLDHLDATVGRGRYVVALTGDHGVAEIPEQAGTGRETSREVGAAIDAALQPIFGPGRYMAFSAYTDVYLARGVLRSAGAESRRQPGRPRCASGAAGHPVCVPRRRNQPAIGPHGSRSRQTCRGPQLPRGTKRRPDHRAEGEVDLLLERDDTRHALSVRPARAGDLLRDGRQGRAPLHPGDARPISSRRSPRWPT